MKTHLPKVNLDQRKWHVVDANGAILGRLAAQVANALVMPNPNVYGYSTVFGNNGGASFEPGELQPPCAQQPSGSVWYRYTASATKTMSVGPVGQPNQDVDEPTIAVFSGTDGPTTPEGWDRSA